MVQRMLGRSAVSASALASEIGVSQPTLSRWLREAGTLSDMSKRGKRRGTDGGKRRAQDLSVHDKLRLVVEASALSEEELGEFLRRNGLHKAQLEQWRSVVNEAWEAKRKTTGKSVEAKKVRQLERELARKDKALAEAAALLVLKKKVQAIWGDEDDDT
jgi:predicted DNA-binding transcriptional regulator YafY